MRPQFLRNLGPADFCDAVLAWHDAYTPARREKTHLRDKKTLSTLD